MPLKLYQPEVSIKRPKFLGSEQWELHNLRPVSVIFGKNGSGKSLLLRAWRDADETHCHYVVPERTGDLEYNPTYLQQQIDPKQRRSNAIRNFLQEYRRQIIARIQVYFSARGDTRDNRVMPGNPDDLERLLTQLLPDFLVHLSGVQNPPLVLERSSDNSTIANIDQLSSGEAQVLTLALDILTIAAIWAIQGLPTRIMLVDEPDPHIHPDLQVRFADFLIEAGRLYDLQIVIATHSTTMLAAIGQFAGEESSVIYLDRQHVNFTGSPFTEIRKNLAACLGGHALMGPLFSVPLLLVEGDDDYRIWSQVPRHNLVNFAVLPSSGHQIKKHQRVLEQLFASLREDHQHPAGIALLDGDTSLPEPNPDSPQQHVKFIQLACRESENLYLTDEVLSLMGVTWPDAVKRIVSESLNFGEKAPLLGQAQSWDRKQSEIKPVINEISRIIDPKNVHWTVRVGTAIGRSRPSGELLDFLGKALVDAVWGILPIDQTEQATTPELVIR